MKSNKGLNRPSGVCVPYAFLLFMTKSGVGAGGGGRWWWGGLVVAHIRPEGRVHHPKTSFSLSWLQAEAKSCVLIPKESFFGGVFSFLFF